MHCKASFLIRSSYRKTQHLYKKKITVISVITPLPWETLRKGVINETGRLKRVGGFFKEGSIRAITVIPEYIILP
jgi:hypothetical protein